MLSKIVKKSQDQKRQLSSQMAGFWDDAEKLQIAAQKSKNTLDIYAANIAISSLNSSLEALELNTIKLSYIDKNGSLTANPREAAFPE